MVLLPCGHHFPAQSAHGSHEKTSAPSPCKPDDPYMTFLEGMAPFMTFSVLYNSVLSSIS